MAHTGVSPLFKSSLLKSNMVKDFSSKIFLLGEHEACRNLPMCSVGVVKGGPETVE